MTQPPAGIYYIVNRVLSPTGDRLAVTWVDGAWTGLGPAHVTPLTKATTQRWNISPSYGNPFQWIIAENQWRFEAGNKGEGFVTVRARDEWVTVWVINGTDEGYTIQDRDLQLNWGLSSPTNDSLITLGESTGSERQKWVLVPA